MKFIHLKNVDSTSTFLKRNYLKYKNFTFVSADCQTNGHGRMGRVWHSEPKNNLLFSVLIKDKTLINKYGFLSLASASVILSVLYKLKINDVSIKWPNDVFVKGKKIAGVLLESISKDSELEVLVLGVGINVNQTQFTNDLIHPATSLCIESKKKYSIQRIKRIIYKNFLKMFKDIKKGNQTYLSIAKNNNFLLNKEVFAEIGKEKKLVKVIGINDDNSLKILVDGIEKSLFAGEITFHL